MKPILFTFAFAATLAAQNFIQMPDPQFGPCVSASIRTRLSGTNSVTSSSLATNFPFMLRVSRNRVPTPVVWSERNSILTISGTAFANCVGSATALKTSWEQQWTS
jgi:hypothetical protein